MTLFQWILAPLLFAISASLAWRILRRQGGRFLNLVWAGVCATAGLFVLRPSLSQSLAHVLGIGRGTDLVVYVAVIVGVVIAFHQYRRHRNLVNMVTELVRHVAIENSQVGGPGLIEKSTR